MDKIYSFINFLDIRIIFDVVALFVTLFVANKTFSKPVLLYDKKSTPFIRGCGHFSQLEVKYKSREIDQLTATTITMWNNGKKTLENNDIPTGAPLKLSTKDNVKILGYRISEINNKANKVFLNTLKEEKGYSLKIDFSYLDPNDGFKVEILHTGRISSDIKISGEIKGKGKIEDHQASDIIRKFFYKLGNNDFINKFTSHFILKKAIFVFIVIVLLYSLYSNFANLNNDFNNLDSVIIFGAYLIIFYWGILKDKIPQSLK